MKNYLPNVEVLSDPRPFPPYVPEKIWRRSPRVLIFTITFLIAAIASLVWNYSRPAIYRSAATLLTSAMTAIDRESTKADVQHVAIQKQVLLGKELLEETLSRLNESTFRSSVALTLSDIQNLLTVEPVVDTNLVEIQAEGANAKFLPVLINTWVDVYLDARKEEVKTLTDDTTKIIEDELKGLEEKVSNKRAELETFRKSNDILSTGRDENEALARLKGLNDSLNLASEQEIKAKSNLDAIKSAIAEGQPVVPEKDQGILQTLEKRRQELKEKQAELSKQFTQDYINLQPALKVIPEEIEKIEREILKTLNFGKSIVRSEAEKDYAAAQQTVKGIRMQLDNHKQRAAAFTSEFAKHETLKTDLESLEKLYRETQERLVQIQTSHKEKYPQVSVISRAYEPDKPIRPDYNRDALIAIAGSLLLGLFAVWITDYLNKKHEPPVAITISGSPTARRSSDLSRRATDAISHQQVNSSLPLEHRTVRALAEKTTRELSNYELKLLLDSANLKAKQIIGFLLSGLTTDEIRALKTEQIDLTSNTISLTEPAARVLPLHHGVKTLLGQSDGHPVWEGDIVFTDSELAATVFFTAIDSGLAHPEELTVDAIRHSYIAYLVRQGLRISDLKAVVGYLDPEALLSYSAYSPPQRGRSIAEIELLHPALISLT